MSSRKPKIVMISYDGERTFAPEQVARLREAGEVEFQRVHETPTVEELNERLDGARILGFTPKTIPWLKAETVERLPQSLEGLAVFATGVDFVDLTALARRGLPLAYLPDYSATSVAEHAVGLMLTMSRRLHLSRDRVMGRVPPTTSLRGFELHGKVLGLIGVGRIGSRVIPVAQALGMQVLAHDPRARPVPGVTFCGLDDLLASADVVSLHVSTSLGEDALLDERMLAKLRPTATIINTARVQLVDDRAAARAISEGRLRGYAVDEYLPHRDEMTQLLEEGRIVETGHTAWYSDEALARGLHTWVENVVGLATGRPYNLVRLPAGRPRAGGVDGVRRPGVPVT